MLEQTRSLNKEDAIAQFIKKTGELNVYVNTANVQMPDEDVDELDEEPLLVSGRPRADSKLTCRAEPKLTEEQIAKREMEVEQTEKLRFTRMQKMNVHKIKDILRVPTKDRNSA